MPTLTSSIKRKLLLTLTVAIVWQLFMFIVGWLLSPHQGPLGHMNHWDAGWYLHILQYGYGTDGNPAAPAFYPLFPLLVRIVESISFGLIPALFAALLINTAALWAALWALDGILQHFKTSRAARLIGIAALLAFPSAFFMHVFYSEAVFIAIAFWSYYFALQRKWPMVGAFLAVLTAARLPSLLFVALCGLEYLRAYSWDIKKSLNKNVLWFLLAPLGFVAYGIYLSIVRGDFLAMFHAYSATNDWSYQAFNLNIFATLYDAISVITMATITHAFTYEVFINSLLPLVAITSVLVSSIYLLVKLKKNGIPLFAFGILAIILFTLNSNVVSVHRYALACIVMYIAISLFLTNKNRVWMSTAVIALIASALVQLFIYSKFISTIFAG